MNRPLVSFFSRSVGPVRTRTRIRDLSSACSAGPTRDLSSACSAGPNRDLSSARSVGPACNPGPARAISRTRTLGLALALALFAALLSPWGRSLGAQELPWLSKGQVRLDFAPRFWTWDSRYGETPEGVEKVELLGSDLTADPLGSEVIPGLTELETALGQALEDPSYRVKLGVSQAYMDQSRLVFPFRLEVGVTDWLTVGAMAPLVRPRYEITFTVDADSLTATEGISPSVRRSGEVVGFLDSYRVALEEAQDAHPGDPDVQEAQAYYEALSQAYSHGSFFPVSGSGPATQLQDRLDQIRAALQNLGISGIPPTLPLADGYLDEEGFRSFLGDDYMRAFPLENWTTPWTLGDVELTANVRLLHRGFQPDSAGVLPDLRLQVGGGVLVRLGTGAQEDYLRFFDQDIGDGQLDLEASVFGLLELGSRFGAWGRARYGIQNEGEVIRRIATPTQALPGFARVSSLTWTPGNYLELELNPRVFLSPSTSFGVRYRYWSKGEDSYAYSVPNSVPGGLDPPDLPPAELLNQETEQTLQEIGISATFSTLGAWKRDEASLPLYIRVTYFHPAAGGGGQTPKGGRFEAGLTIYRTLWGGRTAEAASDEPPGG